MGGFFGVVSKNDCIGDLFYGTDYHSHLGTRRGGLAVQSEDRYVRHIHDISNAQFRSKFDEDIRTMKGNSGIGVISDYEDQPLVIASHLGLYVIVTVSAVQNIDELIGKAFQKKTTHFSEMSCGDINPTEVIANLINQEETFERGIQKAQETIEGSCSLLLLTKDGIYAARDRFGRTPVAVGSKENAYAISMETCAFPNLGYHIEKALGPGEILFISTEGIEQRKPPGDRLQVCSFLWVYYGFPASIYEDISVELVRYRCGKALAMKDDVEVDYISGIPDSGIAHAIGYANERNIPYGRIFVKYTPTWARSFMPQVQEMRDLVARMKLIPVRDVIMGQRLLFCDDSIVRGTQLKDTVERLYHYGAKELHMRLACPPLIYGCKFLNFSRTRTQLELAGRKAIAELEGPGEKIDSQYADVHSEKYEAMVEKIQTRLGLTSLKFQALDDLVSAIGLPKEKLCTYCWDGVE